MKKVYLILISVSVLILLFCICMTGYLLFSNYQNVRLFKQAENNFQRGDAESLHLANAQLQQVIARDDDNEAAYIMLGAIAEKQKSYPEQVYYCFMAHRLNPLSKENKAQYLKSLCLARYFDRVENFLSQRELADEWVPILLYAAGRNGSLQKYKQKLEKRGRGTRIGELALLLFENKQLSNPEKLAALETLAADDDAFLKQEILAAKVDLYLAGRDFDRAGKALEEASALNFYSFAPVLARFYANFQSFGKAVSVFEKYLAEYHDPFIAMQTAEIYCVLKQTDKIARLRTDFQADSGNVAMLCSYYFDALTALAENDMASLKELTAPLRKSINSPLADFMYLCADLQGKDLAAIRADYEALLARREYLDLQKRADRMVAQYVKQAFAGRARMEALLPLVTLLHSRRPDAFTAKFILLEQKKNSVVNVTLLKESLAKFGNDPGIVKIGIEYFMAQDPAECERLISFYKETFPRQAGDMLRYEINLAMQAKQFDKVSLLFRKNFSPAILPEYWAFASVTMREVDLQFLSRNEQYAPFCNALLLLKKGDNKTACDLLQTASAGDNPALLFFAAKTLAENNRIQPALGKYELLLESPYRLAVLLNTAELYAEIGDWNRALAAARQAYNAAPDLVETQLCYGDKLCRAGYLSTIPDVVKLSSSSPYRRKLEKLWVSGMQKRIQTCDPVMQQEKCRELCRQLLAIMPRNPIALEALKKLNKMPQ